MPARRGPGWYGAGPAGPGLTAAGPTGSWPAAWQPSRQTETGRPMPPGLARLPVQSQPGLPISAPPGIGRPGTRRRSAGCHRPRSAIRRAEPLARQRPGGRGAGPGDLGTAGRGVNCWSPACRGRRGGRGPELGIGISKPAPAMRAATAAAPARPIGLDVIVRVGAHRAAGHNMNARRMNHRGRRCRDAQNWASDTKGQDSGNDESSPDTHDSSMAISQARGPPPGPLGLSGATTAHRRDAPV